MKKNRSKKQGADQSDYIQPSFFDGDNQPLQGKGSDSLSGGDSPTKRNRSSTFEKQNFQTETDKGIVKAFTRQISFSGVEHFTQVQFNSNFDLWPKLAQQWADSKKAYQEIARLVGKAWNG